MPKTIRLSGFVGDELTPENVKTQLDDAMGQDIRVQLYTPGGFIYEGFEIHNLLSQYPAGKDVVMGGLVASIGTYIAAAFSKENTYVTPSSVFMIHNVSSWAMGDARSMRDEADRVERSNRHVAEMLARKSGKTVDEITALMDAETWLYGQEIIDEGFAGAMLEPDQNAQPRDIAIQQATAMYRRSMNYMNKTASVAGENNNHSQGDGFMDKTEILKRLNSLKSNGEVTLPEIANAMGLKDQLITDEHRKALETVNALTDLGCKDPAAELKGLREQLNSGAAAVRNAKLQEVFGVSSRDKDGKEINLVLAYAADKAGDKLGEDLTNAINALKEDPILLHLQSQRMDHTDGSNQIGVHEGSNDQGSKSGPEVVDY